MRTLRIVAAMALLAGPVYAQGAVQGYGEKEKDKSLQQIQSERDAEKAYKRSLGSIPDQGTPNDPWGNVRSDSTPKPAAKTVSGRRTKTGSTGN
jgi:hypothetical protein